MSLFSLFLPAMFGVEASAVEQHGFTFPLQLSGLGLVIKCPWLLICLHLLFVLLST